jgi:hypothetical protein
VTPFRALAVAHLQSTWNRMRRQLGARGVWAFVALLSLLSITIVLPVLLGLGAAGYFIGAALEDPESARWLPLGALLLTSFPLVGGFLGGLAGGTRQLPWDTLRVFPVRARTLFAGELFAGAAEPITIIELTGLGLLCAGACVSAPRATLLFLTLFVTHGLGLLSMQQLVGSFAQRLAKRFRTLLLLLPLFGGAMSWLGPRMAESARAGSFDVWLTRLEVSTRWLPARQLLENARGGTTMGALGATMLALALVGALTLLAFILVSRERDAETLDAGGKAAPLWSFDSQLTGIARLQFRTLAGSLPGRYAFVIPLLTLVLIRGPLAMLFTGRSWTAQAAFAYASLASTGLLFNQFGLDRHGVKVLLLLPIEPLALLRGKLIGFAGWQSLQAALLTVLMLVSGKNDPMDLLAGLALYVCVFQVFAMVGQFASIWQPRPLQRSGLRASQPSLLIVLLTLGTLATTGLVMFGLRFVVTTFAPGWELGAFALFAIALFVALFPVTGLNAAFLNRNREQLVETLGASG